MPSRRRTSIASPPGPTRLILLLLLLLLRISSLSIHARRHRGRDRRDGSSKRKGGANTREPRRGVRVVFSRLARAVSNRRRPRRRGQRRVLCHTGPHTTAFARCTPFLEDFISRRSFLSAHLPSVSNPARDAFRLRFRRLSTPPRRRFVWAITLPVDGPEALAGERRAAWNRMSPGGKAQFEWPTPGFPRLDDEEAKEGGGGGDPFDVDDEKTRQGSPASENFCYVVMTVNEARPPSFSHQTGPHTTASAW